MVDSALARLNQDPYDSDTVDLISHLFIAKPGLSPTQRARMTKVKRVFENVNRSFRQEVRGIYSVQPTDAVIYCDTSRYVYKGERDRMFRKIYYDTATNEDVVYSNLSCHGHSVDEFVALAMTENPLWNPRGQDDSKNPVNGRENDKIEKPTQIQLCPWFIDWIKNRKYKTADQLTKRANFGRFVINTVEKSNFGLRQIDAFVLLDKVLLHEMTHGRAAWNIRRKFWPDEKEDPTGLKDVSPLL
ncbi:hypothetical protein K491DRAFT_662135 [Lophiostoma macrostomum CBS 122681]|uniref:SprT-like domain-containing protein n=1 Tax=Lophiostoma macrostomum CBS 122681 TaxID=1314788 RepID=A0A6A6T315_9PLEO|nr:hypothetical protein K491DRAFT_662135 [Lophiostoma macrostomum CBS 122681]